jgi:hypothetical protein
VISAAAIAASAERVVTNEGLVVLARAGYNERFLIELIQSQPHRFDTSVVGLVYLAKQGISEKIVRAVIAGQKALERRENDGDPPPPPPAPAFVRVKRMKREVLVPVSPPPQALAAGSVIFVEEGVLGDRFYMSVSIDSETVAARQNLAARKTALDPARPH